MRRAGSGFPGRKRSGTTVRGMWCTRRSAAAVHRHHLRNRVTIHLAYKVPNPKFGREGNFVWPVTRRSIYF